jgi:hypothetical protein
VFAETEAHEARAPAGTRFDSIPPALSHCSVITAEAAFSLDGSHCTGLYVLICLPLLEILHCAEI